jgi:hypothetical protein
MLTLKYCHTCPGTKQFVGCSKPGNAAAYDNNITGQMVDSQKTGILNPNS